jgi:hypothetical protein
VPEPAPHRPDMPPTHYPVTKQQLIVPKLKECNLNRWIYIVLFQIFEFSILNYMLIIANVINIQFQIYWLMKEHQQVSTLSNVLYCSWHPLCRQEQPIESTCKY